jgi:hypothetical protein
MRLAAPRMRAGRTTCLMSRPEEFLFFSLTKLYLRS